MLITNTFDIGGSNIFILGLYKFFKMHGFIIKIYAESIKKKIKRFNSIDNYDILQLNNQIIKEINKIISDVNKIYSALFGAYPFW